MFAENIIKFYSRKFFFIFLAYFLQSPARRQRMMSFKNYVYAISTTLRYTVCMSRCGPRLRLIQVQVQT